MTEQERAILIESLIFLSGREGFWWEGKTDEELLKEYDRLQKIY